MLHDNLLRRPTFKNAYNHFNKPTVHLSRVIFHKKDFWGRIKEPKIRKPKVGRTKWVTSLDGRLWLQCALFNYIPEVTLRPLTRINKYNYYQYVKESADFCRNVRIRDYMIPGTLLSLAQGIFWCASPPACRPTDGAWLAGDLQRVGWRTPPTHTHT